MPVRYIPIHTYIPIYTPTAGMYITAPAGRGGWQRLPGLMDTGGLPVIWALLDLMEYCNSKSSYAFGLLGVFTA